MENQTIIVKKIKKGGHGHHGGAWKVAFADFATAMMAFFLLLWLIASTTKEERAGISEYFSPPTQGLADGSGTQADLIDMGGGQKISQGDDSKQDARKPTEKEIQEAVESEKKQLESLMEDLKKLIEESQALKPFKDQLLLDITPEGLRIQIVDKENRPMFDSGSAELKRYTKEILHELAKTINTVPNRISLTGHTDAARFVGRENYSNWELSADRANASRRELIVGGLAAEKIAKVVGLASMVPFDKEHPRSPINRRIAIIVLNKAAEAALFNETNQVSSAAEGEQLITDGPVETKKGIVGSIPMNKTFVLEPAKKKPVTPSVPAKPEPVAPAKPEPVVKVEPKPVAPVKPQPVVKAKVKAKPKPVKKAKPSPKKAADDADLTPAQKDEQQFINIPSPISPINPIKLPGTN
jgi:chemotaxis protein MotB